MFLASTKNFAHLLYTSEVQGSQSGLSVPLGTGKLISILMRPFVARRSCAGARETCLLSAEAVGGELYCAAGSVAEGFGVIVAAVLLGFLWIQVILFGSSRFASI